jgi:SAM-dependent methyltransferase
VSSPEPSSTSPSVVDYLNDLGRWRFPPEGELRSSSDAQRYTGWRRLVVKVLPQRLLDGVRLAVTRVRMLTGPRRLRQDAGDLRLHLACGEHNIAGWVNVDLAGARADVTWDLRRPLPVEPGTVAAIFHEHFLEHLPLEDAIGSLRQCHRLLQPGGVLRIGVPDFRMHMQSYVESDGFLESIRPGRPAPLLALNELVYSYGHRSLWDIETFQLVLEEIGFTHVGARESGESRIEPAPDSPERRLGTLYVEAVKPDGE